MCRRLENEIEMLREAAVNYKSRATQSELDDVHSSIENLNRSVTSLKCKSIRTCLGNQHFVFLGTTARNNSIVMMHAKMKCILHIMIYII